MNRYDSYKPTGIEWIGEIPEHWEVKRLKYVALVQPSNVDKKTEEGETSVLLCNYMDVYKNEFINSSISFMEATATRIEIEKFKIEKWDVLVTKDSETPDDIANPALIRVDFDNVVCGYHLTQIRPDRNCLLGEYLFRLFQENKFKAQFEVGANGVTRFGLSTSKFTDAYIPLPSVTEQTTIANYLDQKTAQIDKLIANKQQLIELLKEERTAIINEAVSGEGKNWEKKKLKYVAKMQGGFAFSSEDFVQNGIQLIKIGNLYQNEFCLERQPTFLPEDYLERFKDWVVSDGDVLMSMTGTLGKRDYGFAILVPHKGDKYLLNQRVSKLCFKREKVLQEFGLQLLRSTKYLDQLFLLPTGTKQGNFSNEQVLSVAIEYPKSIIEQDAIVEKIREIERRFENTVCKIKNEIELIEAYKIAVLSEVVTGKINVLDVPITISIPSCQAALAAEIMQQLAAEKTFGRVKFQKILYLCEYSGQLAGVESNYQRAAAGPLDDALLSTIEKELRALQWFDTASAPSKKFTERIVYSPLPKAAQYEKWYNKYWAKSDENIQRIIGTLRFANTDTCEMIATLFAAWNDLIIRGFGQPSDDAIITEVYNWHIKKQRFPKPDWQKELSFMRKHHLIPTGFGKPTTTA